MKYRIKEIVCKKGKRCYDMQKRWMFFFWKSIVASLYYKKSIIYDLMEKERDRIEKISKEGNLHKKDNKIKLICKRIKKLQNDVALLSKEMSDTEILWLYNWTVMDHARFVIKEKSSEIDKKRQADYTKRAKDFSKKKPEFILLSYKEPDLFRPVIARNNESMCIVYRHNSCSKSYWNAYTFTFEKDFFTHWEYLPDEFEDNGIKQTKS